MNIMSGFGSWFTVVAIYTLLLKFNAPALIIALAAAFHWLPGALQAPISGTIIDRSDTKKLMFILLFIEMGATICMIYIDSAELVWLLLVLVFIKMSSASFFFTAEMALIPSLVSKDELRIANDINSITWSVTFVLGMALGGLFVEYAGVKNAFLLDAFAFLVAISLLTRLNIPKFVKSHTESFAHFVKEGYRHLKEHPFLIHLILLHATVGFTAFDALVTLLAKTYYINTISEPLAIGFTNAVRALGLAVGPFIFFKFKNQKELLGKLLLAQGISIIIWSFLQHDFYTSLIGSFLVGLFTTSIWSITYSLIQSSVEKRFYGRVVAYNDMFFLMTNAFVSMFIGVLASFGLRLEYITVILGVLFLFSAFYYRLIKNKI